jgi:molybdopterin synthase catalytic subunit
MAEAKLRQVVAEARERWPAIRGVAVVHRTGRLEIGEMAILVAIGAAHRGDGAFEAARYVIDRTKEVVPVWKKEVWVDGEEWIEGDRVPR